MSAPARLLGLSDVLARPSAPIIVVDGAKARVAASRLLPDWAAVTWVVSPAAMDWSPLRGRQCCGWHNAGLPQNDLPDSYHAMLEAAHGIELAGGSLLMVSPPHGVSEGWNLADAESDGWTTDHVEDHIRKHTSGTHPELRRDVLDILNNAQALLDAFELEDKDQEPDIELPDDVAPVGVHDPSIPFRFLGHNKGVYYYLSHGSRQVTMIATSGHSRSALIGLAGLDFWLDRFPAKGKDGFSLDQSINWMIASSHHIGVYEPGQLRGRGAWWDNGRAVLHCGNKLVVDGIDHPIEGFDTRFVYEAGARLEVDMSAPLTNREANKFVKLCGQLIFERQIHARLLAGFCALAPIGGALGWRPHLYIVGESGSGKSWLLREIVGNIMSDFGINIGGDTSEAAIRQTLGGDALPVIFDDTDKDTRKGVENMDAVLGLIRFSSSDGRSRIMKGGANGQATAYDIRSCFILASIGLPVSKQADATRITVLTLERSRREESDAKKQFQLLESTCINLLTPEYIKSFHARSIRLIPVIRANAKIFAAAAAAAIGTQRLGDQYGALLAGAYSLHSEKLVTIEAAQKWVNEQDWQESQSISDEKDHVQCLKHISQSIVRTDAGERQISELVEIATSKHTDPRIGATDAYNVLRRYGMMLLGAPLYDSISISNSSVALARLLQDTPWSKNWSRILKRIDGAKPRSPTRYDSGRSERGTVIQIDVFLAD